MMQKFLAALVAIFAFTSLADAQNVGPPYFPATLPSGTVVGRTQAGVGPAQAVTLATLSANLTCSVGSAFACLNGATFTNSNLSLLGSSTGATTFTSANSGASNFTLTFPAVTGILITTADSGTVSNTMLAHASTTVNGVVCTLGSTCSITATASSVTPGTTTVVGGQAWALFYQDNNNFLQVSNNVAGTNFLLNPNQGPEIVYNGLNQAVGSLPPVQGPGFQVVAGAPSIELSAIGTNGNAAPQFIGMNAENNVSGSTPGVIHTGAALAQFWGMGYNGSAYAAGAILNIQASQTWSGTANGATLSLIINANNTVYGQSNEIFSIDWQNGFVLKSNQSIQAALTVASVSNATLDVFDLTSQTQTITGTTSITTAAGFNFASIYRPTYTDGSAVTITNASSLYIANCPLASGLVTITNCYALNVAAGLTQLGGHVITPGLATSGTPTGALCADSSGNVLNLTKECLTTAALNVTSPGVNPNLSTSSAEMFGLGAAGTPCSITPTVTGRVYFTIGGALGPTSTADFGRLQLAYGSGAAPALAAAATGTNLTSRILINGSFTSYVGFQMSGIATGLTVGTAYWFDLNELSDGAHQMNLSAPYCNAMEF